MTEDKQKERFVVRDGYSFLYQTEIRDGQGNIHSFGKADPVLAGGIIEIELVQAIGQEHKLERVEALTLRCNNSGCFKEFETTAFNLAYAWCPHCGGRGGDIVTVTKKSAVKKKKKVEEVEVEERLVTEVETPVEEVVDRQEKGKQRGRRKRKSK